jgi:phosphoribosylformylglycinamidine synthase
MLRFRGSPALSPFRLEKLLAALQQRVPVIIGVYAEFIHFVDGRLTTHDREVLDRLLRYGPLIPQRHLTGEPTALVIPRPGTISPWSSKATDIAHNCGLQHVRRIERGVAYYLTTAQPLTAADWTGLQPALHDRMTEVVLSPTTIPCSCLLRRNLRL